MSIEKRKFFLRRLALKFIGINFLLSLVVVVVFIEEVGLVDEKVLVKKILLLNVLEKLKIICIVFGLLKDISILFSVNLILVGGFD